MITLDIKEFKDNIKSLADTSVRKYTGGMRYLYDTIYSALMDGKDIYVGDIDFSRFSEEEYEAFYDKVMTEENSARELCSVFDQSLPCNVSEGKVFF